jgi:AraC-like DNA-binding protein
MNVPNYLLLFASLLCFIISFFIIIRERKSRLEISFLGVSLLVFSLFFITNVLWYGFELILVYPHFLRTISPILFLAAPFFYLGIRDLVSGEKKWSSIDWIHFLPAILHIFELIPIFSLTGSEKRLIAEELLRTNNRNMGTGAGLLTKVLGDQIRFFLMLIYFGYAWFLLFKSKVFMKDKIKFAFFDSWLRSSLIAFGLLQLIFMFQYFLKMQVYISEYFISIISGINILLLFLTIIFYSIFILTKIKLRVSFSDDSSDLNFHQSHLQVNIKSNSSSRQPQNLLKSKENNESYTEDDLNLLKDQLFEFFEQEKIFLVPNLLVHDFAKKIKVPVRKVPFLFFSLYGKTFKDTINQFRIKWAISKLEEGYLDSFTLESLGEECGFNSRTTFFNAFKKETGISPSEYWKRFCMNIDQEESK